jgi:hypothetical protein
MEAYGNGIPTRGILGRVLPVPEDKRHDRRQTAKLAVSFSIGRNCVIRPDE